MKQKLLNSLRLQLCMLVALFTTAFAGQAWGETTFQRINSTNDVAAGNRYIIVSETNKVAMGTLKSKHGQGISVQISSNTIIIDETTSGVDVFTLGGSKDSYTLRGSKSQNYLGWESGTDFVNQNSLSSDTKQYQWIISFNGNNASIANVSDKSRLIRGYNNSKDFRPYTTSNGSDVQLYKEVTSSSAVATTTTIDATGITNTDVYVGTAAGSLSATVTADGSAIEGSVTWSGSNDAVATIDASTGAVTLVAAGSVTFTANYAGIADQYQASNATYEMTVSSSAPYNQPTTVQINMNYQWLGSDNGKNIAKEALPLTKNDDNITTTITEGSQTQPRGDADYIRIYAGSTISFKAPTGYNISTIEFTTGGKNTWTTPTTDNGSLSDKKWEGSAESVTFTLTSSCFISKVTITLVAQSDKKTAAVSIDKTALNIGETAIVNTDGPDVTLATSDANVATISGTTVTAVGVGAATITATWAENDEYDGGSKEFSIVVTDPNGPGTVNNPYSVAQALAIIAPFASKQETDNEVYVKGIISRVDSYDESHSSITYFISDDGTTTSELEVYSGKGLDGADFGALTDLEVGAEVVILGKLMKYNTTSEVKQSSKIISIKQESKSETPVITVTDGTDGAKVVTITASAGATIYYTTDGTAPSEESAVYESAMTFTTPGNYTIKAIAVEEGKAVSITATQVVTVDAPNYIELEAGYSETITTFPSFSGQGYKTLNDYKISVNKTAYDWSVTDGMKSGNSLQLKGSSGKLVSPEIRAPYGFTVNVSYTSDTPMTLTSGETSATGAVIDDELSTSEVSLTVENTAAAFTLAVGSKYAVVNSITIIANIGTESVTVTSAGFATYCSDKALDFTSTEIKAFVGTVSGTALTFTPINQVPANTGVLLYKEGGATEDIPVIASAAAVENNCLTGVNEQTTIDAADYILSTSANGVGFYKAGSHTTLGAHKAYISADKAAGIKSFAITFGDTDAIGALKAVNTDAAIYDLSGRRVSNLAKGIYVIGGKKVVVK